jgi:hypothetical protein
MSIRIFLQFLKIDFPFLQNLLVDYLKIKKTELTPLALTIVKCNKSYMLSTEQLQEQFTLSHFLFHFNHLPTHIATHERILKISR